MKKAEKLLHMTENLGEIDDSVVKKANSLLSAGLKKADRDTLGFLVGVIAAALEDANFSTELKQILRKFSNVDWNDEYGSVESKTGISISKLADWNGTDIMELIATFAEKKGEKQFATVVFEIRQETLDNW